MKLLIALTLFISSMAYAAVPQGRYIMSVKRTGKDMYMDQGSGVVVVTRACLEYASIPVDAVLVWRGQYMIGSKLIFNSGAVCEVKAVE